MPLSTEYTGFIIQARSGSTRMPDKMFKPFYGNKSILEILLDRFKTTVKNIPYVVATTTSPFDDRIERLAEKHKINVFRGSEENVLQRFIDAAETYGFKKIIRVCADNPLFDISGTLKLLDVSNDSDYTSYKLSGNKPSITTHNGFWGEVVTVEALKKVKSLTTEKIHLEHVTNFIYTNPELFQMMLIKAPGEMFFRDDVRLTVDTNMDFNLVSQVYSYLMEKQMEITVKNVLVLIDNNPDFLETMKNQISLNSK